MLNVFIILQGFWLPYIDDWSGSTTFYLPQTMEAAIHLCKIVCDRSEQLKCIYTFSVYKNVQSQIPWMYDYASCVL